MPPRRAATTKAVKKELTKSKPKPATATSFEKPGEPIATALAPTRAHSSPYHYPLLIDDESQQDALLTWFKSVEDSRTMPWRKAWIDPSQASDTSGELKDILNKRSYEVWVSEVSKLTG
jgi:A/G-specific adenine glycosylase